MKTRSGLTLLLLCSLTSCDDPASSPDAAVDASSADANVSYPTCADPETTFAFPSPRFESEDGLVVPETGLTAETLRAEGWHTELAGMGLRRSGPLPHPTRKFHALRSSTSASARPKSIFGARGAHLLRAA